jgi:hypothetical protein
VLSIMLSGIAFLLASEVIASASSMQMGAWGCKGKPRVADNETDLRRRRKRGNRSAPAPDEEHFTRFVRTDLGTALRPVTALASR